MNGTLATDAHMICNINPREISVVQRTVKETSGACVEDQHGVERKTTDYARRLVMRGAVGISVALVTLDLIIHELCAVTAGGAEEGRVEAEINDGPCRHVNAMEVWTFTKHN